LESNPFKGEKASEYDLFFQTNYGRVVYSLEKELLLKGLSDYLRGNSLEVGCGTGIWMKTFKEEGFKEPVGLDISYDMLVHAKRKGLKNLVMGTALRLPFRDDTFDLTYFVTSLEFIVDRERALLEATRVSKKAVAVVFLNKYSLLNIYRIVKSYFSKSTYSPSSFLTIDGLKKLASFVSSVGRKGLKLEKFLTTINLSVGNFIEESLERKFGFELPFGAFALAVFRVVRWS